MHGRGSRGNRGGGADRGTGGRWAAGLGAGLALLVAAGVGGWRLLVPADPAERPVVVGTTDRVTALDPAGTYDAGSWRLFSNVFQSLMSFTPGSPEPVPDAAEQCRFTDDDLRRYRCVLREGLTFSDGSPLTAQDVKHSFDRVLEIAHPQGPAPLFDTLKEVRTDGGAAVEFLLDTSDATFPFKIAGGAGAIVSSDAYPAVSLRRGGGAVGSGPYLLADYGSGRSARLVPNPRYTGLLEEPPDRAVEVRYYGTPDRLAEAWRKREIDVSDGQLPPEVLAETHPGKEDVEISELPGGGIRFLAFNHRAPSPAAHPEVRRAVALLVDREALVRRVHRRTVEELYSLVPQGVLGHGTPFLDRHGTGGAEAEARRLLAGAGIETPVRLTLAHADEGPAAGEAEELRRQLESSKLFEVSTEHHAWEDFLAGFAAGRFDSYLLSWFPDFPDADTYTASLVGTGSALHTGYSDEEVDALIRATRRSFDRAEAAPLFEEIDRRAAEEVPLLPLWQARDYVLSTDDVSGEQYLADRGGVWRLWRLERI